HSEYVGQDDVLGRMSALGGKGDSDCDAKCPLLTQSGHRTLLCVSLSRYDVPRAGQELINHKFLSRNSKTGLALIVLKDVSIILPARARCWAARRGRRPPERGPLFRVIALRLSARQLPHAKASHMLRIGHAARSRLSLLCCAASFRMAS